MIKQYKVYQQQERQSQKIIGIRPLMEAIRSGKDIDKIFVQKGLKGELFHELKALMNEFHLSCQLVPVEKLNRISRANHQGVI
ncbi:MAG: 23S rRNA (guanosine(2251)-2'-O)-methyltransferase RlmB, partial [Crocinitomicaceae bacterium]|nr:23S rRNA (guanosine(2251)-2'-O)-methyltransferase RlmB [Crocinitomicaceae bacterium]